MRTAELVSFILARDARRRAKDYKWRRNNVVAPDPILDTYRFCNVRRNDDRVTVWLHKNWLEPLRDNPDGWFAFALARCAINKIDTMEAIGLFNVVPFKREAVRKVLKRRREQGLTLFGAAYMIGTQGNAGDKVDFLLDKVLDPLWRDRKNFDCHTLAEAHEWLDDHYAVGSFTAAQVLADWKYAHPERWPDFATFAASGPGSRRGLNRVMGNPLDSAWREDTFRATLTDLRREVLPLLKHVKDLRHLTAQDLQNCLCEFDKYERARLGEGRPKQIYTPHVEE